MTLEQISVNFDTTVVIRLVGFHEKSLRPTLETILQRNMLRTSVLPDSENVHHTFSATVEFYDSQLEFREHFEKKPAQFVVYIVKCDGISRLIDRGNGWVAIAFGTNDVSKSDETTAYRIISKVFNLIKGDLARPIATNHRLTVTNRSDSVIIYQPPPVESFEASHILIRSLNMKREDLTVKVKETDTSPFALVCSLCETAECTAQWIRKSPEYKEAHRQNALPIFLLPHTCSQQYGSIDLAFAPTNTQKALQAVAWKSLYGWEPNPVSEPFVEAMTRRNMAAYPLSELIEKLKKPLEEITELKQIGSDLINDRVIDQLDTLYTRFSDVQKRFTRKLLVSRFWGEVSNDWDQLVNSTQEIVDTWNMMSENVQRRRVCVGNLRDLTEKLPVYTRPSVYCAVSLAAAAIMARYVAVHGKRKEVVLPSPLL